MLVEVARGADYKKGSLYIVYAIEETSFHLKYAVYPVGQLSMPDLEVDPFYVQAGIFNIVDDRTTQDWVIEERHIGEKIIKLQSFPEFFSIDGFWYRWNDLDLEGSDYDIVRSYKKKYEEIYADLIALKQ